MDKKILDHFQTVDPVLFALTKNIAPIQHQLSNDHFFDLCNSIISQQLSTRVADVILERFQSLFPDQKITPEGVMILTEDQMRAIGLSGAKTRYIKNLAEHVVNGQIVFSALRNLSDAEVIAQLIKVKGIGQWTAEMFLMFSLAREDVFAFGDLGLKKAIQKVYQLPDLPTLEEMKTLSEKWAPYRTFAARILWRSLEIKDQAE